MILRELPSICGWGTDVKSAYLADKILVIKEVESPESDYYLRLYESIRHCVQCRDPYFVTPILLFIL